MKMFMVLAVLALAAAPSSSAQQIDWEWPQQGTYGAAAAVYPCAEFLLQPQCSPVAAPYYARRGQTMWQPSAVCQPLRHQCCLQLGLMDAMSRCQAMCGVAQSVVPQLQLQGAAGGLYEPPAAALTMQQWRQLLPPPEAPMAVAQAAQDLLAMCGLDPLPI